MIVLLINTGFSYCAARRRGGRRAGTRRSVRGWLLRRQRVAAEKVAARGSARSAEEKEVELVVSGRRERSGARRRRGVDGGKVWVQKYVSRKRTMK